MCVTRPSLRRCRSLFFALARLTPVVCRYVDVDWPPLAEKFMSYLMFFSFNIEVAHPDCVAPMSFYVKFAIVTVTPLSIFLILIVLDMVFRMKEAYYRDEKHKDAVKAHKYHKRFRTIRQVCVIFITAIYSPIVYYCFKMFDCMEAEGEKVLAVDTELKCAGTT